MPRRERLLSRRWKLCQTYGMPDTTSTVEPSELVKASKSLMELWDAGVYPLAELERQALGAKRLEEAYSCQPWHTEQAKNDPDYWNVFYASRINW